MKRVRCFWFMSSLLVVLLLTACSTSTTPSATSARPVAKASPTMQVTGASGCHPASPIFVSSTPIAGVGLPQVQGKAPGGELWALIFNAWPIQARQQDKIVWRMTGSGELQLVARGPGGQIVQPADFIPHSGSTWQRPGEEWGSTFTFPVPGCWDIHATRGNISGDVWFTVV